MPRPYRFCLFVVATLSLAGCPTRMPDNNGDFDAIEVQPCDPRVPSLGPGDGGPTCGSDQVIDVNQTGFRQGNVIHVRVDTRGRRNELHPSCVDRDSSEVMLRYTAPALTNGVPPVLALQVTTATCATQFDTVLAVRNGCGTDFNDYSCNNDGYTDDGLETRKSTVYFLNVEPEQYVFIMVDGFDGSAGEAEVVITEITEIGVQNAPCIDVPPSMTADPTAATAGFRCPHDGIRCQPGAAPDGTDLCLPLVPLGAPCDPDERRNVCEAYNLRHVICATNPMDHTQAVCALPGTAPGALCRMASPRCDGRLTCSAGIGFDNTDLCVPVRSEGASCDPAPMGYTNRCDTGLTCCGDAPDAGANYLCRPNGWSPCFAFVPQGP